MTASAIQHLTLNTADLLGLSNARFDPRLQREAEATDGRLHVRAHHFMRSAPMFSATTRDLARVVALMAGNADAPSVALTEISAICALGDADAPAFETGISHHRITSSKGHAFLRSLSWQSSGKVEMGVDGYLLSADGSAAPFTEADVALPTEPAAVTPHVISAITLGGTNIAAGLQSLQVDIAHGAENNVGASCYNAGLPHPVVMAMPGPHGQIEITGTVRHQNLGLSPANGTLVVTFAPLQGGAFVGSAAYTLTLRGTLEPQRPREASHGSPASRDYVIHGIFDGTNRPLTLAAV